MILTPRFKIHPPPRVTLPFDLLIHKLDPFMPLHVDYLYQLTSKSGHAFSKYVFTSLVTDERMDRLRTFCLHLPRQAEAEEHLNIFSCH